MQSVYEIDGFQEAISLIKETFSDVDVTDIYNSPICNSVTFKIPDFLGEVEIIFYSKPIKVEDLSAVFNFRPKYFIETSCVFVSLDRHNICFKINDGIQDETIYYYSDTKSFALRKENGYGFNSLEDLHSFNNIGEIKGTI